MSLFEKACEIYDLEEQLGEIGVVKHDGEEPIAPISHIIAKSQIQITLTSKGEFVSAEIVSKDDCKTVIPVTPESAGRTSSAKDCPHPLSDQLMFFISEMGGNVEKYQNQLQDWEESQFTHDKVIATLKYVKQNSVKEDLIKNHIIEVDENGNIIDGKIDGVEYKKCLVRWIVQDTGEREEAWLDRTLFNSYISYFEEKSKHDKNTRKGLCTISFKEDEILSESHPKGVQPTVNGAKLISFNDKTGFTFRGRFKTPEEALSVSYTASQKAHSALRWLEANQGVQIGNRRFLWFKIPKNKESKPLVPFAGFSGFGRIEPERLANFRQELKEALIGYKLGNLKYDETVIVLALEAATTGRISVTYYNEFGAKDFYERLQSWYDGMSYCEQGFIPNIRQIINYAFGSQKGEFVEADDKLKPLNMQRMLQCVVEGRTLPSDLVFSLVNKFSRPMSYKNDYSLRKLKETTFAIVKKYRNDKYMEEWNLGLDRECNDRSYLFGRLLAIADKLEKDTYGVGEEQRITNATRLQSVFAQRPSITWKVLNEKLNPYKQRLMKSKPGLLINHERNIEEIMSKLDVNDSNLNRPLDEKYVLGYYHQYNDFFKKSEKNNENI